MTKLYKKWNSVTEELGEIFHVLPVSSIKGYISNEEGGGERTPPHTHTQRKKTPDGTKT
jgi:hypothetical protein